MLYLRLLSISQVTFGLTMLASAASIDKTSPEPSNTSKSIFVSLSSLFSNPKPPPVLVSSGEGEAEKNVNDSFVGPKTKLIPEPDPPRPIVLAQEDDSKPNQTLTEGPLTVLMKEDEDADPPLLVQQKESPEHAILYLEPELDPPSILYVENENAASSQVSETDDDDTNTSKTNRPPTRLIEDPDDAWDKKLAKAPETAVCAEVGDEDENEDVETGTEN